jgi:hypothetical protein
MGEKKPEDLNPEKDGVAVSQSGFKMDKQLTVINGQELEYTFKEPPADIQIGGDTVKPGVTDKKSESPDPIPIKGN